MTDAIQAGYEHAVFAVGWLLGVAPVLFLAGSTLLAVFAAYRLLDHRLRVIRVRRQARRSGRLITDDDRYAANCNPDGTYSFPIR